jgi:hypothetical protein
VVVAVTVTLPPPFMMPSCATVKVTPCTWPSVLRLSV